MFNPISEAFKGIYKEKRLFFSTLLSLIVVFVMFNIFIFGIYNLNNLKMKMENSNQGIIYIKTMEQGELENFKNKILNIKGIKSVEYTSKEDAIKILEKELNVDLSEEENPLLDSFNLYINKDTKGNQLREELIKIPEIEEIDIKAEEIDKINDFNERLNKVVLYGGIGLLSFIFILLLNLTSISVRVRRNEIRDMISTGVKGFAIKFMFFLEGLILVLLSTIFAFFIFIKLYYFVISGLSLLDMEIINKLSNRELMIIYSLSLGLGFVIIIYTNFIGTYGYYTRKKEKMENKNIVKKDKNEEIKNVEDKEETKKTYEIISFNKPEEEKNVVVNNEIDSNEVE